MKLLFPVPFASFFARNIGGSINLLVRSVLMLSIFAVYALAIGTGMVHSEQFIANAAPQDQCVRACTAAYNECKKQHGDINPAICENIREQCVQDCGKAPACPDPNAMLSPPQSFQAVTVPSSTQVGQVTLTWSPVPGADAYEINSEHFGLEDYRTPGAFLGYVTSTARGTGGMPLAVPLQPGTGTSAVVSDLPLFYPVDFLITTIKYVTGADGSRISCEGEFKRSNLVTPVARPNAPVWGFADTHTHQFPNLAFSGYIIGQAYGDPQHAFDGDYVGHGIILGQFPHKTGGYPNFDGWPTWNIKVHQQMYEDWLYRAYLGGLRLMVMHGVNNETACIALSNSSAVETGLAAGAIVGGVEGAAVGAVIAEFAANQGEHSAQAGEPCNDMGAVDREIQAAYDFENYLNGLCSEGGGGSPPRCPQKGMGWYHVVTSAKEARETINRGQLAVVLGIEVDRLFDCVLTQKGDPRTGGKSCTETDVHDALDKYFNKGVRHIFPAHLANTAFAGMALYHGDISWNFNNHFINGDWLAAGRQSCTDKGITFDLNSDWSDYAEAVAFSVVGGLGFQGHPPNYPGIGHCNAMGLTPLGNFLISEMMNRHMIIDIDHMSMQSIKDTFSLTSKLNYPVIAGHTGFIGVNSPQNRNEAAKTNSQLQYIKSTGGLVAAGVNIGTSQDIQEYRTKWGRRIPNDCSNSSKTWVQSYLYAVDQMGGPGSAAVAVATDQPLNNFVGPRFGDGGCAGGTNDERKKQSNQLVYDVRVLNPGRPVGLHRAQTFNRVWDFNTDGMAHIGMYPDMFWDLVNLGLTQQDLQPLFRSAEQYIKMWEKAEQISAPAPSFPQP